MYIKKLKKKSDKGKEVQLEIGEQFEPLYVEELKQINEVNLMETLQNLVLETFKAQLLVNHLTKLKL